MLPLCDQRAAVGPAPQGPGSTHHPAPPPPLCAAGTNTANPTSFGPVAAPALHRSAGLGSGRLGALSPWKSETASRAAGICWDFKIYSNMLFF